MSAALPIGVADKARDRYCSKCAGKWLLGCNAVACKETSYITATVQQDSVCVCVLLYAGGINHVRLIISCNCARKGKIPTAVYSVHDRAYSPHNVANVRAFQQVCCANNNNDNVILRFIPLADSGMTPEISYAFKYYFIIVSYAAFELFQGLLRTHNYCLKLKLREYPAIGLHTNYSLPNCTI